MTTKVLVAGDRMSAGKSTVSLGLLAALLDNGYKPSEVKSRPTRHLPLHTPPRPRAHARNSSAYCERIIANKDA